MNEIDIQEALGIAKSIQKDVDEILNTPPKLKIKVVQMDSYSSGEPVANQFIIKTDKGAYFQSYSTVIAYQDYETGKMYLDKDNWDYSNTTAKYRNRFTGFDTKETKRKIKSGEITLVDLN